MKYDKAWWLARAPTYQRDFRRTAAYEAQERAIADIVRGLDFDSVIEIGCGFGRITKLIHDLRPGVPYLATDFAPAMIEDARRYVPGVTFDVCDLGELDQNNAADLVVAVEVLMHRPPETINKHAPRRAETIERDIDRLCRAARRYVLTVDWYGEPGRTVEGCWQHDYATLFAPYGFIVAAVPISGARQSVFVLEIPLIRAMGEDGVAAEVRAMGEDGVAAEVRTLGDRNGPDS